MKTPPRSDNTAFSPYPLEQEQLLVDKVKNGDRAGAREILNELLGVLLFHNPGDINVLKARMLELLTILSRAAVEAGADANILLTRNQGHINAVLKFHTPEQLCAWIPQPLEEFIDYVCQIRTRNPAAPVRQAINYLEANYHQNVTLPGVARHVGLSPSRIEHLFKQYTSRTLSDYLMRLRVEHAKRLLLTTSLSAPEICRQIGYRQQPYFSRIFKRITGLTPTAFRKYSQRG
jgi:two-component system response regulator YesN